MSLGRNATLSLWHPDRLVNESLSSACTGEFEWLETQLRMVIMTGSAEGLSGVERIVRPRHSLTNHGLMQWSLIDQSFGWLA